MTSVDVDTDKEQGKLSWLKKKKKQPRTKVDARRIDYRYAEDGPFFFIKGQGVWTGVILGTTSDDFASELELEQQVFRSNELRSALSAHFSNHFGEEEVTCHDITRHVPVDISRWENQYLNNCWNPSELFTTLIQDKVSPFLSESTPERRQYLLIRLGDFKAPVQLDPLSLILGTSAAVSEEVFNTRDLQPFRDKASSVHTLLSSYGAAPMERVDLAWIIRKVFHGHFPAENRTMVERTRPWRGGYFDEIARSHFHTLGDCVRIDNPHPDNGLGKFSYTTTVTVDFNAIGVDYQYSHAWGKLLRTLQRPVDVSWRSKIVSSKEWSRRIKKAFNRLNTESTERNKAGATENERFDTKVALARQAHDSQIDNPKPVIVSQLRLTFSAPTEEELTDIMGQLQLLFGEEVKVERRSDCQGFLLEEQLPGDMTPPKNGFLGLGNSLISGLTGGLRGDERWTDIDALSFARLDSSPSVGDETEYKTNGSTLGWRGGPIGYTLSNGSLVHFDPMVQMARNSGAGIAILGSSGGGKSSLSLALFFWASEAGAQTIVLDPKNDFEAFVYYLSFGNQVNEDGFADEARAGTLGTPNSQFQPCNPRFWDETSVISLGDGAPGMLDPWGLSDSYSEGEAHARNVVELILNADQMKLVDVAFQKMREVHEKGLNTAPPSLAELGSHLAQEIEHYETISQKEDVSAGDSMIARDRVQDLRRVSDALDRAAARQYGRLMFAQSHTTKPFSIGNQRRIVITLFGLRMPAEGTSVDEWEDSTKDAAAAMLLVIGELSRLFTKTADEYSTWQQRRGRRPRILFIDEGYFITAFKAGRTMLDVFLRQGRSRYFSCVFISQQAKDLNKISENATDSDDASTNQFPVIFVFRQNGMSEARDAMRILRPKFAEQNTGGVLNQAAQTLLKPNEGGQLETGMAVMRDVDARVSVIQVDRVFRELADAAETNAQIRNASQSVNPSADGSEWTIDTSTRDMLRTGVVATEVGEIRQTLNANTYEYGEYEYLTEMAE
ncbi:ATP-binding protein [Corynebacterium crudilactis]|uniref:Uncharacterized protein n=1 Tax=Corynebacterium crudilactis TaxID=1652495 RepID=A0A172QXV1_9CORY|nr:ATP-binding protein [Corynebacterium crudilactis]ANE05537.1 hypothetical protein ccrud_14445 [Corynebacterium crudilactis]